MTNGLFKLIVMTVIHDFNINKTTARSSYLIESFILWHDRLGHVSSNALRKLINLDVLLKFHIDSNHKCEMCVEAKIAKSTFQVVERNIEPLELIHSDICDLKFMQTRGGKKYFITFIDDSIRHCYVYLPVFQKARDF